MLDQRIRIASKESGQRLQRTRDTRIEAGCDAITH